ncbi:MAG: PilZ domain-containing protein [Planctomycetia bacterium]|nr:PilZ domain-containing protein [Planctomycetia bacterium]
MHERRQAFRFRPTPDRLFATIRGKGGSSRAQLLDESATGLAVGVTGQWVPKVGDKIEVELSNDVVVAKVVRKESDGRENILGLLRLSEDPFTAPEDSSVGLSELIAAFRNHGRQLAFPAVIAVVLGAVIGWLVIWKPLPSVARRLAAINIPVGGAPLDVAPPPTGAPPPAPLNRLKDRVAVSTSARSSSPAKTKSWTTVLDQATQAVSESAAGVVSRTLVHDATSAVGETSPGQSALGTAADSFDDLLTGLPNNLRNGYRDLVARASSDLPVAKRAEVDQVVHGVKRDLRALETRAQAGAGGTLDAEAAALLDRAGKQIDAIVAAPQ